ncbi:MAG TPA: exopolysaccharide biosynthesis polyprenyl glycosylphosphotransferase [Acidimicrobiales bacterium]
MDVVALLAGWSVGRLVAGTETAPAGQDIGPDIGPGVGLATVAVGVAATLACAWFLGLYRLPVPVTRSGALGRLVRSIGAAAMVVLVGQALLGDVVPEQVVASVAAALALTTLARYLFDVWLTARRARGDLSTAVVVAGSAAATAALVEHLRLNPEAGFRPTAIVGDRPPAAGSGTTEGGTNGGGTETPWAGGLERAGDAVRATAAAGVLLAVNGLDGPVVNDLVDGLCAAAIPVYLSSGLSGVSDARLQSLSVAHEPLALVRPPGHSALQRAGKRVLDVVVAAILLVVAAPVVAVAALLIKLHDRGPVLFRQVRVGRAGAPFTVVKLRTMEVDAEARLAELRDRNERHGPLFKVSSDPRVTPIGAVLRSTAIDELPQLVCVLTGRMSMVGPRPALPAEAAEFDDELLRRHLVKPGVTGLWQVEANHKASFEEYRRLDLFYVDNWSIAMDLAVLIDTVPALVRRGLRALARPAPAAPASAGSPSALPHPAPHPADVGP